MYSAAIVWFFTSIATALLRSEGDAKRSMLAMMLGGILNAVLDPIFIYVFGWGVPGAAIATVVSICVSALLLFYWLFLKKNTFLSFHFRGFHFNKSIMKDILAVGFPASLLQLSMAIMLFIMNIIVEQISGTDGVAVFSAGWAVAMTASMPLLGMATAVVSVTGAAYGAREYKKLDIAHLYALKIGIIIETSIAIVTFIFAPVITLAFTVSSDMAHLGERYHHIPEDYLHFLSCNCIWYVVVIALPRGWKRTVFSHCHHSSYHYLDTTARMDFWGHLRVGSCRCLVGTCRCEYYWISHHIHLGKTVCQ